jgi:hypothetical protein
VARKAGKRGSVRPRGKGKWELRAYNRLTGKYEYKTVKASSETGAARQLTTFLNKIDQDENEEGPKSLTVEAVCNEWLPTKRYKALKTQEMYDWAVKGHIIPGLGKMQVRSVRLGDLEKFYRKLEAKLAPKTIRHVHGTVRQIFDYARRSRYILTNPADDVRSLPDGKEWTIDAPCRGSQRVPRCGP